MEKRFDYQVVTSNNTWVGGGTNATQDEINQDIEDIKTRLKEDGNAPEELIIFKAEDITQYTEKM